MGTDVLYIFASVAFFIWCLRSLFYWLSIWQHPTAEFTSMRRVFRLFLSPSTVITWIVLFLSLYFFINDYPPFYLQGVTLALLFGKAGVVLWDINSNKLHKPDFTGRTVVIICIALFITAFCFAFPLTEKYLWTLLLDRFLFVIIIFSIFLITVPFELYDDIQIYRASRKLQSLKHIQKVVIIGEHAFETAGYAYQLLKRDQKVALLSPTEGVGSIASDIHARVGKDTALALIPLVMSRLNILSAALEMIHPSVVILSKGKLTHTHEQMRMINRTLSRNGRVIIDSTLDPFVIQGLKKKKIVLLSRKSISDVSQRKDYVSFQIQLSSRSLQLRAPFVGTSFITQLLPAIVLSDMFGMTTKTISRSVESLTPMRGSLIHHRLNSGVVLIDGTNTYSFSLIQEGLSYLKLFYGRRIVVFGIDTYLSREELQSFASGIAGSATSLFVLGERYQTSMRKLVRVGTGKCKVYSEGSEHITSLVRYDLKRGDVVLFLGISSSSIIEELLRTTQT